MVTTVKIHSIVRVDLCHPSREERNSPSQWQRSCGADGMMSVMQRGSHVAGEAPIVPLFPKGARATLPRPFGNKVGLSSSPSERRTKLFRVDCREEYNLDTSDSRLNGFHPLNAQLTGLLSFCRIRSVPLSLFGARLDRYSIPIAVSMIPSMVHGINLVGSCGTDER